MSSNLPNLPSDVLSHIFSLISPPFLPFPVPRTSRQKSQSPPDPPLHPHPPLDPLPPPDQTPLNQLAVVCRASSKTLESARPWLWENVDVRSGRGWLAIVNALTEEVTDDVPLPSNPIEGKFPGLSGPTSTYPTQEDIPTPVSPDMGPGPAADAHVQPETVPGGYQLYRAFPPSQTYPPAGIGSSTVPGVRLQDWEMYSSPPPRASLLLTPPRSRNPSPNVISDSQVLTPQSPSTSTFVSSTNATAIPALRNTRLRGRSRSPRRNLGVGSPSIDSILGSDRSRSTGHSSPSIHRPCTGSLDEDEEEAKDEIMPLPSTPKIGSKLRALPRNQSRREEESELLPSPGPYIRHLTFINFRTIGSRRSQEEAVRGRYVTAGRLEGVIKNAPNLVSLCMTEYVDSSLTYPVVEELFFRGYHSPSSHRRRSVSQNRSLSRVRSHSIGPPPSSTSDQVDPPRPVYVPYEEENDVEKWCRRALFTPLQALDLTGCVSRAFTDAMGEFYDTWLDDLDEDEPEQHSRDRGRARYRSGLENMSETETEDEELSMSINQLSTQRRAPRFTSLQRLSLRACTSLDPLLLHSLVLCFPNLTHLDLSNTRVPSALLSSLTDSPPKGMKLISLSLARCPRLDPYLIVQMIVRSPAMTDLVDLNLFVNPTQGNAISSEDLTILLSQSPCFTSGKLRYLDLSSSCFTPHHLTPEIFPPQPSLVSLGLSHIPTLPLKPIAQFLLQQARNVEILSLTGTANETSLGPMATPLMITLELHMRLINPCTQVPFTLGSLTEPLDKLKKREEGLTRLRVIELNRRVGMGVEEIGNTEWKIIWSKGGRGWYVDTSAGWVDSLRDQFSASLSKINQDYQMDGRNTDVSSKEKGGGIQERWR
ncbi:hypothetical protein TREMEDRAFT_67058 [Tremella mesenterica DSM 1558]|uniref:uncharacterized protein n=1 Tax=Tremella mesenterica (strain ATCC 24925 / CBS 8224 / DSM 1558 / NBRC 9311 / NRRL Y-6157 / RJB 2259-6 / UBC 559-6) TaxID=578456 RepID=UPI0003F49EC0|nr:uncharacterized protein TREMEDRAFT_67058 [Tremella mesenterica DSM 1558]EIW72792.1 hypothetical protein TREMEDRAFT_67058 [Tremella mesenterica DSM 1558]